MKDRARDFEGEGDNGEVRGEGKRDLIEEEEEAMDIEFS